jgi:tRNA(His) 5'-end guanylyltransferase
MAATATVLFKEFDGLYAYTQSDEISVLLPQSSAFFGRGVEKLVSLAAATASAAFTEAVGHRAAFDARLWTGDGVEDVVDYFAWRQADTGRNALSTCAYWALIGQGLTARQAHGRLLGLRRAAKQELLAGCAPSFEERPAWQRRGTGIWIETFEKQAHDPRAQQDVTALRRRLRRESELPEGAAYRDLVQDLVTRSTRPASAAAAETTVAAAAAASPTTATTA